MITKTQIDWLFEEVWPGMMFDIYHHEQCHKNYSQIEKAFAYHKKNFDKLLNALIEIHGIGLTIGSGLIYSVYQDEAIPFDKKTMYHSLNLRILRNTTISGGHYKSASDKIVEYCAVNGYEDILAFVREAEEKEYPSWILESSHPQ